MHFVKLKESVMQANFWIGRSCDRDSRGQKLEKNDHINQSQYFVDLLLN